MADNNYAIDLRARELPEEREPPVRNHYPLFMRYIAFALICGIACAPITAAYADELEVVSEVVVEEVVEVVEEVVKEEVVEVVADVPSEPEPEPEPVPEPEIILEEVASSTDDVATSTDEVTPETVVEVETPETESTPEPEVVEVAEVVVEEISPVTPEVSYRLESSGQHVFQDTECAIVDDGAFYCVKKSVEADQERKVVTDDVFVAQDGDGDTEVYLRTDGLTKKLSDNVYDDDAPAYDPNSGRVVWHGNVNDRYQIFMYDPQSGVRQLTDSPVNSQNPSVDGQYVVWQMWSDENWEVYLADLGDGLDAPNIRRLSGSGGHDMFPKAYGEFVSWQAREGDEWRAKGYNLRTRELSDLGAGTGGSAESARLVLLVERRNADGELERVGYDIDTGDSIALGSTGPAPVAPESLPSPYEDPSAIPPPVQTSTTTPQRDDPLPPEDLEVTA